MKRLVWLFLLLAATFRLHADPKGLLRFSHPVHPVFLIKARAFPIIFQSIIGYSVNGGVEVKLVRGSPGRSFTTAGVSAGFTKILYSDCCGNPDQEQVSPIAENRILSLAGEVRRFTSLTRRTTLFAGVVLRVAWYDDVWNARDWTIHRRDICPALVAGMRAEIGNSSREQRWLFEWYAGPQVKFRTADRNYYHDILSGEFNAVKPVILSIRFGFNIIFGFYERIAPRDTIHIL